MGWFVGEWFVDGWFEEATYINFIATLRVRIISQGN